MKAVEILKRKIHKKTAENKGATLVEMVVVFALLSIFMVSVTQVISSAVMLFNNINFVAAETEVEDMIMTKVSGVLSSANGEIDPPDLGTNNSNPDVNTTVKMFDRTRTKIEMGVSDNKLYVKYPSVEITGVPTTNPETNGERLATNPYIWTFPEKSYQGFYIKNLKIEKAGAGYPANVYKISLTLGREGFADVTSVKYIKCFSLPETGH